MLLVGIGQTMKARPSAMAQLCDMKLGASLDARPPMDGVIYELPSTIQILEIE